jgi:transcriptional regulator with XRE-family HTH domain
MSHEFESSRELDARGSGSRGLESQRFESRRFNPRRIGSDPISDSPLTGAPPFEPQRAESPRGESKRSGAEPRDAQPSADSLRSDLPRAESGRAESPRLESGAGASTTFGERLRQERERRQISLESIAASSKVNVVLFKGLESGDTSRWPAGIFRRSFVRAYATAIGLDADAVVREFLELYPDPIELPLSVDSLSQEVAPPGAGPSPSPARSSAARSAFLPALFSLPPGLRLRVADTAQMFAKRHMIPQVRGRWAAVSVDAAVILGTGIALFLLVGVFWMPLAIFMFCYYFGSILFVGNTPGVCLAASATDPHC